MAENESLDYLSIFNVALSLTLSQCSRHVRVTEIQLHWLFATFLSKAPVLVLVPLYFAFYTSSLESWFTSILLKAIGTPVKELLPALIEEDLKYLAS